MCTLIRYLGFMGFFFHYLVGCFSMIGHLLFWVSYVHVFCIFVFAPVQRNWACFTRKGALEIRLLLLSLLLWWWVFCLWACPEEIFDYCLGKSFQECFQSLKDCFGDQSLSKATVLKWFRHFMSCARTWGDDDRCDRMATTATPENMSLRQIPDLEGPQNDICWNTGCLEDFIRKSHSHSSWLPWRKETCSLGTP